MRDGQSFGYKTVVEEPEVLQAITKYSKIVYRFDDAYRALQEHLSHDGQGIRGSVRILGNKIYYMYAQKADKLAGTPRLSVIYQTTKTQIIILKLYVE